MTVNHLYLIEALAMPGCAPAGTGGVPAPRSSSSTLSAAEIAAAHADQETLYDAISRLRSQWLTHSTKAYDSPTEMHAAVFLDGRRYGEIESLRNIDANQIADVRYLSAAEAGGKYGIEGGLTGVIEVSMKKR